MKKLTLNTNDLNVETFETGSPSKVAGTIKGNQEKCANTSTIDTISVYTDDCHVTKASCLVTCNISCALTCGGSCVITCGGHCESVDFCQDTRDCTETSTL